MKIKIFSTYSIFFLLGLVAACFAPKNYLTSKKLVATGIKTEATVIDMVRGGSKNRHYKPVFQYTDQSNTLNTFQSPGRTIFDRYKKGDVVDIVYNPTTKVARVNSFRGLYLGPIMTLIVGCIFMLVGRAGMRGQFETE